MKSSPIFSILQCLRLTSAERERLLAETEVPSSVAVVFFNVASGADTAFEVTGLMDELADFGECVRVLPEPGASGPGGLAARDFLLISLVPTDALSHVETLFRRPSVERFSYIAWEDRLELERFFQEEGETGQGLVESKPEDLLNQARSFILSPGEKTVDEKRPDPLPGSATPEEHRSAVTRPNGFRAAGVRCGIKTKGPDLGILLSDRPANVALRSTQNRFCSPPVLLNLEHLKEGDVRAVVVNSGNANAATGSKGMIDARRMTEVAAECLGLEPRQVLVCSTGIIGEFLPMEKIEEGIRSAAGQLEASRDDRLIQAIMTTDTFLKSATRRFVLGDREVTIGGIAKGSGMIHPNMATMHAYLTTDAAVELPALDRALGSAVEESFNCLSVDGDTSTSDSVILFANGAAENEPLGTGHPEFEEFAGQLKEVCVDLVRQLARDGEGATHLVRVVCEDAASREDAFEVAQRVATSLLVKTALFGRDPNWGRIIMAIGNTSTEYDTEKVRVWMAGQLLFENGLASGFDSEEMLRDLAEEEVEIRVSLGAGEAGPVTVYTCDLSYDYVRINAEYHT
jgi:glutamate N-acetyltransferase / amino-acid N-acetyltransferase